MYCERTCTFVSAIFKLHVMDTCCLWNLVCDRISVVYYNWGGVFWIRLKILIRNFKVCIVTMIKLEPFKGFCHFISTDKQWYPPKVIFSWLTRTCKYKGQYFIHLFNWRRQNSIYFLHWVFKCDSICNHFMHPFSYTNNTSIMSNSSN